MKFGNLVEICFWPHLAVKGLRKKTHCKDDQALVNALDNKSLIHFLTDETKKLLSKLILESNHTFTYNIGGLTCKNKTECKAGNTYGIMAFSLVKLWP